MALTGLLRRYRARANRRDVAHKLYVGAVRQARAPSFYAEHGVPDSLDGRFDMIVLHVVVILRRLRAAGEPGRDLAQSVFDVMFDDMDQNLREMGVGDLSVGKRVKQMARAFYGRAEVYDRALNGSPSDASRRAMASAIARNVFGAAEKPDDDALDRLAHYVEDVATALAGQADDALLAGTVTFPEPPRPDPVQTLATARGAHG